MIFIIIILVLVFFVAKHLFLAVFSGSNTPTSITYETHNHLYVNENFINQLKS